MNRVINILKILYFEVKIILKIQSQNYTLGNNRKAYLTSSWKSLELHTLKEGKEITVPSHSILTIVYQKL